MLHTDVVKRETLELLKRLEGEQFLADFNLAGGTALAMYLGHRKSVDLDLFTPEPFDTERLKGFLEEKYGFRTGFMERNTLKGDIDGVKIDCITHAYRYLRPPYIEDGVRLYDMADIIAMKLSAIADNGSRLKDFIDIGCLSTRYSLADMLMFYQRKFPESNVIRPFKALTYFEDIDFAEDVVMLNGDFDWRTIARRLSDMTREQNKVYATLPVRERRKSPVIRPPKKGRGRKL